MKNKILTLALSIFLAAGTLAAQGGRGKQAIADLGLTAEQKPQVQAILSESREAAKKAREENKGRTAMREIQQQTQEKLGKVLTPEQMEKWQTAAKERKGKAKAKA
jgi:Spy/CpxP family protein refolding chaperone